MSALFNFDKNKLERFEDKIFSLGSLIGQILLPIGMIMLLSLPFVIDGTTSIDTFMFKFAFMIISIMCCLLGTGATACASLDQNTIWHKLNQKLKVFGYK